MDALGWFFIIVAAALLLGAITTAWQAFSRPPRARSAEMKKLDQSYFEGEIDRQEYLRQKTELEKKGMEDKAP